MHMYMYVCVCKYVCIYVYFAILYFGLVTIWHTVFICIYTAEAGIKFIYLFIYLFIYIYIYIFYTLPVSPGSLKKDSDI